MQGLGVKKGDKVSIFMPMVSELPLAMLACARIGAVHSVVFGGFSKDALAGRIIDAGAQWRQQTQARESRFPGGSGGDEAGGGGGATAALLTAGQCWMRRG